MPRPKKSEIVTSQSNENELSPELTGITEADEALSQTPPQKTAKPKKAVRKKKVETDQPAGIETENSSKPSSTKIDLREQMVTNAVMRDFAADRRRNIVLTVEAHDDVHTVQQTDEIAWHEIQDAYITHKILSGTLAGLERNEAGSSIAIVQYNNFRVLIPLKEMFISQYDGKEDHARYLERQAKNINKMLGAEIDFAIRGIDSESRSVVASRRDAMLKKRHTFYMERDINGLPRIHPGRIVQGRIIAVSEKTLRAELFGVDTVILARDLAWFWIGDIRDHYAVGDTILLRITTVSHSDIESIKVTADARSLQPNTAKELLKKCRVQGKYAGKVTDVQKGVIFIRLANGVNAIAHSCFDYRTPGKKDDVSFIVTKLDEEWSVAVGIVTRIIRQNL